jgi:pilus assembly protein CpaC
MRALPILAMLLISALPINVAEAQPEPAPPERSPAAVNVRPTGEPIVLETGKGTLIRLARPATTVFVANPNIADVQIKSPLLVYVSALAPGETVIYAADGKDRVLLNSVVRVIYNLSRLRDTYRQVMPGEQIRVSTIESRLVLSGIVSTAAAAEKARQIAAAFLLQSGVAAVTTRTAVPQAVMGENPSVVSAGAGGATGGGAGTGGGITAAGATTALASQIIDELIIATPNQVNLRVRFSEVDRNVLKQMGINWTRLGGKINVNTTNPTTGLSDVIGEGIKNSLTGVFPEPGGLTAELDALTQEGLVTTLAEPNLTAVSGQTASFLVGGLIYIPCSTTASIPPTITNCPVSFGVRLDFTPTVVDANHIALKLRPEVSSLDFSHSVGGIPEKKETVAESSTELGSGQSFVMAGLLEHLSVQDVSKIPGLGDIPVLGALFRSDQFSRGETELVIAVTPYLVKPVATAMATPTDGWVAPHDMQRVINSDTYRQGLAPAPRGPLGAGGTGLIGPAGFQLN